jgi:ferredoxin
LGLNCPYQLAEPNKRRSETLTPSDSVRVSVDADLCMACGYCIATVPAVFDSYDDGTTGVRSDDGVVAASTVPLEHLAGVEKAAYGCPTQAIVVNHD